MNKTITDQKQRLGLRDEVKGASKKPYVKPEVRYEHVFETAALSCGKVQVTQFSCMVRKTS
jgi:hypothetical protein